jgi:hypothetical protein
MSAKAPWRGNEMRHFRALVRRIPDETWLARHLLACNATGCRGLERRQWLALLSRARIALDPEYGCSDEQWARIRWLQHGIGWDDRHLENYIKKHGHIDSIRFMTVDIARAVITGMHKILDWQERKQDRGYQ